MIALDVTAKRGDFALRAAFETKARALALFGSSGAGKSTLAMLIAGLARPDAGFISIDGEILTDTRRGIFVPPERRRIGVLFQDSLLFPHLSVRQNIMFGRYFTPKASRRAPLDAVVERLGIGQLMERGPAHLSGGEKQRVALARALLATPRLLVLDEPTAALDAARRLEILALIELMRDEFETPIIFVSHATEEVARLADEVVVLDRGAVAAQGAPADVLPGASRLIEGGRFDLTSVLRARVGAADPRYGVTRLAHPAGEIILAATITTRDAPVRVYIRATDVALAKTAVTSLSLRTMLRGVATAIDIDEGPLAFVAVELVGGDRLTAAITRLALDELEIKPGDEVYCLAKTAALDEREI